MFKTIEKLKNVFEKKEPQKTQSKEEIAKETIDNDEELKRLREVNTKNLIDGIISFNVKLVKESIEKGADVNYSYVNKKGESPLTFSKSNYKQSLVLWDKMCLDQKTIDERKEKYEEIIKILEEAGAEDNQPTSKIIQIVDIGNIVAGLCEDGTLWEWYAKEDFDSIPEENSKCKKIKIENDYDFENRKIIQISATQQHYICEISFLCDDNTIWKKSYGYNNSISLTQIF